jgi:hypothetical protein
LKFSRIPSWWFGRSNRQPVASARTPPWLNDDYWNTLYVDLAMQPLSGCVALVPDAQGVSTGDADEHDPSSLGPTWVVALVRVKVQEMCHKPADPGTLPAVLRMIHCSPTTGPIRADPPLLFPLTLQYPALGADGGARATAYVTVPTRCLYWEWVLVAGGQRWAATNGVDAGWNAYLATKPWEKACID